MENPAVKRVRVKKSIIRELLEKCESENESKTLSSQGTSSQSKETFNETSQALNRTLSKEIRQEGGIFFTPRRARELAWDYLKSIDYTPTHILEPSCGSCEFIQDALENYPDAMITGVEYNKTIFDVIHQKYNEIENVKLQNSDFLTFQSKRKSDLIIGNPPYFVMDTKNPACMTGRPNIYVAFLYKCLTEHLSQDGILAFVLPTSLLNCSYYEPMRRYIWDNCSVKFLQQLDVRYYETGQDTMLLIIQNRPDLEHSYMIQRGANVYLTEHKDEIVNLLDGSRTITELGFRVQTGCVVWNQVKEDLTPDSSEGTVLIYSTNIVDNKLVLDNIKDKKGEKHQYISNFKRSPYSGPSVLINRGYGNNYNFNYVYVDFPEYYVENHVNVIHHNGDDLDVDEIRVLLQKICTSLSDERTKRFIEIFVGNGALSKTEIETIIPIYV